MKTKSVFRYASLFFLVALLLAFSALPVSAAKSRVIDDAGLLTSAQCESLAEKAESISAAYGLDVVVLLVDSIGNKTPEAYADDYYDYNGYAQDGFLILWANGSRDCHISTSGRGAEVFTDWRIENTLDHMEADMRGNDFYNGMSIFLDDAYTYLQPEEKSVPAIVMISVLIGLVVGLISVLMMKAGMKTARTKKQAVDYVRQDSFALKDAADIFLFNTYTRVKIPKNNTSGGSSMHTSSSGRSHGGGGRKF